MSNQARPKFQSISDWHDFIEAQKESSSTVSGQELREYRVRAYEEIEEERDRELLVFASDFPNNFPDDIPVPISIEIADVDGFTDLIDNSDSEEVDVLLHSPGGAPDATERIVKMLRDAFESVSFLVPHSAYSAATMLCLSGDEVILHPSASLGPIDPQIDGTPARAIKKGFENVRELLVKEGPDALPAYIPLIEKYSLHLLEICDDSEELAKGLVEEWLHNYMFDGDDSMEDTIEHAKEFFSDYDKHKLHSRPLTYQDVDHLGLNIQLADGNLKALMREAYIHLYGLMEISPIVKIYENSDDLSWGRNFQVQSGGDDN